MTASRLLVVGVGNDLLGDDAAGLLVGDALKADGLPVEVTGRSGLALLDAVVGYRRVLLVDSQVTGRPPGSVAEFTLTPDEVRSPSAHYLSYGEALAVGAAVGLDMPEEVHVLAVERDPDVEFGHGLSDPVRAALPGVVERARAIVRGWIHDKATGCAAAPDVPVAELGRAVPHR